MFMEDKQILVSRGIELYHFNTIDSTNKEARRYAAGGGQAPALFLADAQTEGRGRLGRSFFSPRETGIYMTLLLEMTDCMASFAGLTSAVAVAVTDVMDSHLGVCAQIKWVNDVYLYGKKVCGILAESFTYDDRHFVAVGVGINLATEDFPTELKGIAGSLGVSSDRQSRMELAALIGARIWDVFADMRRTDRSFIERYRRRSMVIGEEISFTENGAVREGRAVAIDDDGGLMVETCDGESVTLCSGEITVRVKSDLNRRK